MEQDLITTGKKVKEPVLTPSQVMEPYPKHGKSIWNMQDN